MTSVIYFQKCNISQCNSQHIDIIRYWIETDATEPGYHYSYGDSQPENVSFLAGGGECNQIHVESQIVLKGWLILGYSEEKYVYWLGVSPREETVLSALPKCVQCPFSPWCTSISTAEDSMRKYLEDFSKNLSWKLPVIRILTLQLHHWRKYTSKYRM